MITHPPELDAAYARSPLAPIARLRFYVPGTTDAVNVAPTGGTLTWDASVWPRTTLTADLPTTITPSLLPAAITAFGGRVTVTLGGRIRGRDYTFTAATLAVARVEIDRPDAAVRILATSLEAVVNEDRYDTPVSQDAGELRDVVAGIVRRSIPGVSVVDELGAVGSTIIPEGTYTLDGDVWPVIERIMDDHGAEAFFDAAGRLVLRLVPVAKTTPDLTLAAGTALTGYGSVREWGPNRVALVYTTPASDGRTRHDWVTSQTTAAAGRIAANADPGAATRLFVHKLDRDGTDVGDTFTGMRPADTLARADRIRLVAQAGDGPASRVVYEVTAAPTLANSVWTIPVRVVRAVRPSGNPVLFPDGTQLDVFVRIQPRRRVGLWQDTTPTSPTRVGGPYGRHTYREDLPVERGELPSQTDADAAALAMARRVVGRFRQVSARGVPAPWIIPGDTIRLGMLGGLTESHVVQSVTHPLSGLDVSTFTTRDAAYVGGPF